MSQQELIEKLKKEANGNPEFYCAEMEDLGWPGFELIKYRSDKWLAKFWNPNYTEKITGFGENPEMAMAAAWWKAQEA